MSSAPTQGSQGRHIPYAVIPLLAIIGAAAFVMVCYVLYKHRHGPIDGDRGMTDDQAIYMREVRQRNREDIEALTGGFKAQLHRQQMMQQQHHAQSYVVTESGRSSRYW